MMQRQKPEATGCGGDTRLRVALPSEGLNHLLGLEGSEGGREDRSGSPPNAEPRLLVQIQGAVANEVRASCERDRHSPTRS